MPCTWRRNTGAAPQAAAKRAGCAATRSGASPTATAEVHRGERAAALPRPRASHQRADTARSPRAARSQLAGPAHAASGQAEAWVVLNAASAMQLS